MTEQTPIQKLRRRFAELRSDRSTFDTFYADVNRYVAPDCGRQVLSDSASSVNDGRQDNKTILNDTATMALETLASGMQSGLTSKARKWFYLSSNDPALAKNLRARKWYDDVQTILEGLLSSSNFYQCIFQVYREMGAFGTGAMMILEDDTTVINCRHFTAGTYYLTTDAALRVDGFYYKEYLTARQIVERYGEEKCPENIMQAYRSGNGKDRFKVVNAVLKNPSEFGIAPPKGKSIASVHFLESNKSNDDKEQFLRVSGYNTWPVMTPRWSTVGEDVYGWSPVRNLIGDIKTLQEEQRDMYKLIAKTVNPPMRVPVGLERRGLNVSPGAINPVGAMDKDAVAPLYTMTGNISDLAAQIAVTEQRIKSGLYNDIFLNIIANEHPQMTASEVVERRNEKMLMMGPVVERAQLELLNPAIARVFYVANTMGVIPPPPEILQSRPIHIEYISILSQAQKAADVNRIEQAYTFMGGVVQVHPELRFAVNGYEAFSLYCEKIGVPARMLLSKEEYEKAVGQFNEQQAQEKQMAAMPDLASAAKQASEINPANVQQVLSGMTGGTVL